MMSNMHATESCGCGATVIVEAYTAEQVAKMLLQWRETHQHIEPIFPQPRKPRPGDRIEDGGRMGTIVSCPTCSGDGILHDPDEKPEPASPSNGERAKPTLAVGMVRCACGDTFVAPGTRAEVNGISHGETPCFLCDDYGRPLYDPMEGS